MELKLHSKELLSIGLIFNGYHPITSIKCLKSMCHFHIAITLCSFPKYTN